MDSVGILIFNESVKYDSVISDIRNIFVYRARYGFVLTT